jgi:hypothetical protein
MWCLRCYQPVRQLTPRPAPLPTIHFLDPKANPPTSRWRRGPTTFGPFGRLAITALVAVAAPWAMLTGLGPLALWSLLGYSVLAVTVLRDVWRRERVLDPRPSTGARAWVAKRFPRLGRPIPPIVVVGILAAMVAGAFGLVWANTDAGARFYLVAGGSAVATGVFLLVWNEL